jgi:hypothetical protein
MAGVELPEYLGRIEEEKQKEGEGKDRNAEKA